MSLDLKPKKWAGALREVTLGAGSRRPLTVGGGNGLPLHTFEAAFPHRPVLALEITDVDPVRWVESVRQPWEGVLGRPAEAARRAVEEFGADLLLVHLMGAHPDRGNRSPEQAAADAGAVLEAVDVPLIVKGPGAGQKQNDVLARVAEELPGRRAGAPLGHQRRLQDPGRRRGGVRPRAGGGEPHRREHRQAARYPAGGCQCGPESRADRSPHRRSGLRIGVHLFGDGENPAGGPGGRCHAELPHHLPGGRGGMEGQGSQGLRRQRAALGGPAGARHPLGSGHRHGC